MIIDGHIYLWTPEEDLDAYGKYLRSHGKLKGWDSSDELLRDMDKDGIDFGVILHGSNTKRQEAIKKHPDRLAAFAGVRIREIAHDREGALSNVRKQIEGGCVGIGDVSLYAEVSNIFDQAFLDLVELAAELNVPLHLECTATVGEFRPGKNCTPLYDYEELVLQYPALKLILSSWGGGLCLYEMMPELPVLYMNVYYDTAGVSEEFDPMTMMRTVPKVASARKILYGSGTPNRERRLDEFRNSDAPQEVIDAVLGNNLMLLLGLK